MFIKLHDLISKYNLKISGVIHVGAHHGQEYDDYKAAGIRQIVFVEPCKAAFEVLHQRFAHEKYPLSGETNVVLINAAFGSRFSTNYMNTETANTGQSNSLLEPAKHLEQFPDIKFTGKELACIIPMDSIMPQMPQMPQMSLAPCDFLNIDTQGFELEVLKGGIFTIQRRIKYIYLEVNQAEVYKGCPHIDDIDGFLSPLNFERVETFWCDGGKTGDWGDAFYIRKEFKQKDNTPTVAPWPPPPPIPAPPKPPIAPKPFVHGDMHFTFKSEQFTEGDKVKVSGHFAGYKSQHAYMNGIVFLKNHIPYVKIDIPAQDIEKEDETELACWNVVVKANS